MNKIYLSVIIATFILVSSAFVSACYNPDQRFTMIISDVEIDLEKLKDLCTEQTCTIETDYIAIRSGYNPDVSLIVGNTGGTLGIYGLMTKLPYKLNESCCQEHDRIEEECYSMSYCLIPTTLIPEDYNWGESISVDLNYLKDLGVLDITPKDIADISSIARDSGIRKCSDGWKVTGDCLCDGSCPDCIGSAFFPILPENNILDEKIPGHQITPEEKSYTTYWIAGLVIVIIMALILFLVKKKE
jgi:hypothetical protein